MGHGGEDVLALVQRGHHEAVVTLHVPLLNLRSRIIVIGLVSRIADPAGFYPDPTFEKKLNTDPTLEKKKGSESDP